MALPMNSRFGVQLEGDEFDLSRIKRKVNSCITSSNSRFVENFNDVIVLRCCGWDSLAFGPDLQQIVQGHVDVIAASLRLLEGCGQVTIGTLYELEGGSILNMQRITPLEVNSQLVEASRDDYNDIITATEQNSHFRSAVSVLGSGSSWYEIYASLESIIAFYGGERYLLQKFPDISTDIAKLKRTANSYRHVKGAYAPIKGPMPLNSAIQLLRNILQRIASSLVSSATHPTFDVFTATDRNFPTGTVTNLNALVLSAR